MTGNTLDPYSDRYAHRTHGLAVSEIRALFAVANRPEVVSLAGGMPYTAALPLDAVGSMLGELVARNGATVLQYCAGQGDVRLRELICEVMAEEAWCCSGRAPIAGKSCRTSTPGPWLLSFRTMPRATGASWPATS